MKYSIIKYQFKNGTAADWHREVARFISALDGDPELKGRISYRCMKNRDDQNYYHLAAAADDQAIKTLQSRDFFKAYQAKTRQVADGEVTVTPVELIAETAA
jgi:hypothetical protein